MWVASSVVYARNKQHVNSLNHHWKDESEDTTLSLIPPVHQNIGTAILAMHGSTL